MANQGVLFTLTLNNGAYSILHTGVTVTNKYLGTNLYTDSTNPGWTIDVATPGETGVYTISTGGQYLAQSSTAGLYTGYTLELISEVTEAAKWKILTKDEAIADLQTANADNPKTATFLFKNPGFNRNISTADWTMVASNQNLSGGSNDNRCAESWQSTFTLSQTASVPNGYYVVKAQAALTDYTNAYDGADYPVVYANDETVPFNNMETSDRGTNMTTLSNSFQNGKYGVEIPVVVADGELTIGVRGTRTNTWCIWDEFDVTYYGQIEDLSIYEAQLATIVESVGEYEGKIPSAAYSNLEVEVNENNGTYSTSEEYETAISNIKAAIAEYAPASLVASYAEYKKFKDTYYAAVIAVPVTDETAKEEHLEMLDSELSDVFMNVEDCNDTPEWGISAMKGYLMEYIDGLVPSDPDNQPFDVTFMIVNPSFENNDATGWSGTTPGFQSYTNAEFYKTTFDIYQTLENMPKATYKLMVQAYERPGWADNVIPDYVNNSHDDTTYGVKSVIYVNTGEQLIKNAASAMNTTARGGSESNATVGETTYYIPNNMQAAGIYFGLGYYDNEVEVLCTTGTIKFGFRADSYVDGDWTIFDNFRLYLTGVLDLSIYQQQLADVVETAQEYEGKIPRGAWANLQSIIRANEGSYETADAYSAAIAAIEGGIENVKELVQPYAAWLEAYDKATTIYTENRIPEIASEKMENVEAVVTSAEVDTVTGETQALTDVMEAYDEWTELYAYATDLLAVENDNQRENEQLAVEMEQALNDFSSALSVDEIRDSYMLLKTIMIEYIQVANPVNGYQFNITWLLTNHNLEGLPTWQPADGWYSDQTEGNRQVMENSEKTSTDGAYVTFYECWNGSAFANNQFNVYQLVNLPEGSYSFSCAAFASSDNGNVEGVYLYANDTQGEAVTSTNLAQYSMEFEVAEKQDVKIGIKAVEGNANNWTGMGYVELYKTPAAFSKLAAELAELAESVEQYNGLVPTLDYTNLKDVADENNGEYESAAGYQTAIQNIKDAITQYASEDIQASYGAYKAFRSAYVESTLAVPVTDNGVQAEHYDLFQTQDGEIVNDVEYCETTPEEGIESLKTALMTYIDGLVPAYPERQPFDVTFMIVNPSFDNNNAEGWSGDVPGFEQFNNAEFYQREFDIYQILENMPKATYQLKVQAFERPGWADNVIPDYMANNNGDVSYGVKSVIYVNNGEQLIKNAASAMNIQALGVGNESAVAYNNEADETVGEITYYIPNNMEAAEGYFKAGYYDNDVEVLCTTGTIRFGFRADSHVTADWTIFDNFRLYLTGVLDLSVYETDLALAVEAAESYEGQIPTAAWNNLKVIIDRNNGTYDTGEEYSAAILAIQEATDNIVELVKPYDLWQDVYGEAADLYAETVVANIANSLSEGVEAIVTSAEIDVLTGAIENLQDAMYNYDKWAELKAYAEELQQVPSDADSELKSDFDNQVTIIIREGDNSDSTDTLIQEYEALKGIMTDYVAVANPVGEDNKFNLTWLLTNPDLTKFWTGVPGDASSGSWWVRPEGWATEQADGNFQVMTNADVVDNPEKGIFIEYWSATAKANNLFDLYLTTTLPAGAYSMSCYAFAKDQRSDDEKAQTPEFAGVYFYANDTQGSLVSAPIMAEKTIEFINDDDQDVKIGLKSVTGNTLNWMGIGYVELYKIPAKAFIIDENEDYDYTQDVAGDVVLNRTIREGLNTLVLPFSMTQQEIEQYFGEGSVIYLVSSYDPERENIEYVSTDALRANTPVLLRATEAGTSYEIPGRTLVAGYDQPAYSSSAAQDATYVDADTYVAMIGTYTTGFVVPQTSGQGAFYVINGDKYYNVDQQVTLKTTRAYYQLPPEAANAKSISMTFDGEATGIMTVEDGNVNILTGDIYDLSGRKVSKPGKGIYIINNKKVYIK